MWQSALNPVMRQVLLQVMRQPSSNEDRLRHWANGGSRGLPSPAPCSPISTRARIISAESMDAMTYAKQRCSANPVGRECGTGYVRGFKADSGNIRISYSQNNDTVHECLMTVLSTVAKPSANTMALTQGQVNMNAANYR
jgi:hypothetical protein